MTRAAPSGLALLVRPHRVEASLWRRFRLEEALECRGVLFDRYVGLARSIAARHYHRRFAKGIERGDFEQFAYEGLLQAIDRFDPLQGVPFGAYARRRIAGSVADGISKMTEVGVQISHRHRVEQERLRSLARARADVRDDSGPDEDALLALSDLALGLALGLMLEGTSLMEPADGLDTRPTAYETLEWREMQAGLVREVARLPAAEATVVRQHYDNGLSFAQVAELLGLSRGRVSQLHRAALDRLRKKMGAFN